MELDELTTAWESLNKQLRRDSAINLAVYTDQKLARARSSLRPLFWGQTLQILFGLCFLLLAIALWSTRPRATSVIIAGVVVQAYGIGCIVAAGMLMGVIRNLDYSGSVLEMQEGLARVRRVYLLSSIVTGMSWWFMWVPVLMVLLGVVHVNLYAHAPAVVWTGMAVGVAGTLAMVWLYKASRKPQNERLRRFVEGTTVVRSLQKAHAHLNEVRRFAEETA